MLISSTQNPRIKQVLALSQKSTERRSTGLIVVEGHRELLHCVNSGAQVQAVFYCPAIYNASRGEGDVLAMCEGERFEVTKPVYDRIAYREGTEGIMAVVKPRMLTLDDLQLPRHPLLMVLERVEKPGNLGAVLRSADAAGADAVIVCDPLTDLYNPNLIRASIGGVFCVPTAVCNSQECIAFLKERSICILTAQLQDSYDYYDYDMRQATAIVMGTESTGLTQQWRDAADAHIRIPMLGRLDSLNVSVSAAILMYEAVRQRRLRD